MHTVATSCLLLLSLLGQVGPSGATPAQPTIATLEQEVATLEQQVEALAKEQRSLEVSINAAQERGAALAAPALFFLPDLLLNGVFGGVPALFANAAFIFGVIALLVLLLRYSGSAARLLSLSYPFRAPARERLHPPPTEQFRKRTVWIVIAVILLVLFTAPAWSETPDEAAPDTEAAVSIDDDSDETSPADAKTEPTPPLVPPDPGLKPELEHAAELIKMSPLHRALYVFKNAVPGGPVNLYLPNVVLDQVSQAAHAANHAPLVVRNPEEDGVLLSFHYGSLGHWITLASLQEAAGMDSEVPETLDMAMDALPVQEGEMTVSLPFQIIHNLAEWLLVEEKQTAARRLVRPAAQAVSDESQIVEQLLPLLERIVKKDELPALLIIAYDKLSGDLDSRLRLVQRLHGIGADVEAQDVLQQLASRGRNTEQYLKIASIARELGYAAALQQALVRAVENVERGEQFDEVLSAARAANVAIPVMEAAASRVRSYPTYRSLRVSPAFSPDFGITVYNDESAALGLVAGSYLFQPNEPEETRLLFASPVEQALSQVINSLGEKAQIPLNDLLALTQFYQATNHPAYTSANAMVDLQRSLRGEGGGDAAEEARLLALRMRRDALQEELRQRENNVANMHERLARLRAENAELLWQLILAALQMLGKLLLIALALWMAFSRGYIAARRAHDFRFSHFCWKFGETIGFIFCCTLLLLLPGGLLALLCQDRLKHLRIVEMPPFEHPAKTKAEAEDL